MNRVFYKIRRLAGFLTGKVCDLRGKPLSIRPKPADHDLRDPNVMPNPESCKGLNKQAASARWLLTVIGHIAADELAVEIRFDEEHIGEVMEVPAGLALRIWDRFGEQYCHDFRTLPLEELLTVLGQAKETLIDGTLEFPRIPIDKPDQETKKIVNYIVENPNAAFMTRYVRNYGNVVEVRIPGGQGLRFDWDRDKLIGFLEPMSPREIYSKWDLRPVGEVADYDIILELWLNEDFVGKLKFTGDRKQFMGFLEAMSSAGSRTKWRLQLASDVTANEICVELWLDDDLVGRVQISPSGPELRIYDRSNRGQWTCPLDEFLTVLGQAKDRLVGTTET